MKRFAKIVFGVREKIRKKRTKSTNWRTKILSKVYLSCFKLLKFVLFCLLIALCCSCIFFIFEMLTNRLSLGNNVRLGQQVYLTAPKNIPAERTMDIIMGSDDGYIRHCAAAMASILLNCDASSSFRFHILDGGISSDKKEKLLKLRNIRNFEIRFYDMTKHDWSIFPDNRGHTTLATYYRLRIPEILSKKIPKALYLDGDIIIEQDLKELWDTDISNYVLGAVEDEEGIDSRDRLGLSNKYFNAGVLLLNLDKLRQINLSERILAYLKKGERYIIYQDQDILNGLFNNQYKELPLKWNVNRDIYLPGDSKHTYSDHYSEITKRNPAIIHFTGGSLLKPWNQEMLHPLSSEYWNYYKYTDFYSPDQRKSFFFQLVLMNVALFKHLFHKMLSGFQ